MTHLDHHFSETPAKQHALEAHPSLLAHWQMDEKAAPMFVYYLNRHIELDGDSRGPSTWKIISELTGDDPAAIEQLKSAAEEAINARLGLWDGLAEHLGA